MVDAGSLSGLSWQDRYFEEGYLRRWRLAPAGSNEVAEVQAFLDLIGVSTSARILDIGCGNGRYGCYGKARRESHWTRSVDVAA